jgi:putative transposase
VKERCDAYKELFRGHIDEEDLKDIRSALQTGTPLGNDYFKEKIEKKLKTKVGQARRGRPDGLLKGL